MKTWTIGKRIGAGFALVLLITAVLGLLNFSRFSRIRHETQSVKQNLPLLEAIAELMEGAKDNVTLVYKHIYSTSAADMDRLEDQLKSQRETNTKALDFLDNNATSTAAKAALADMKACRAEYQKVRTEILLASRASTNSETSAKLYLRARETMDPAVKRYADAMDKLWKVSTSVADEAMASVDRDAQSATWWTLIGMGLALAISLVVAAGITRSISTVLHRVSTSLSDGSEQVAGASGHVSSSSQSLAEGASEQAASIEETSSSLEEMSSMTRRNAENAHKVNDLAKQARTGAERGVTDMQAMSAAMDAIKNSSDDIAKIIKTIDEIAFQTNILALNAAVEAARAGDAGMGFAVVAEEVRSLAQRSAQAAKETSVKIGEAIGNTSQGVEICTKVGAALNGIVSQARLVDELAADVATASGEQSQGIDQVNLAVSQMDKVTQSNAAHAEESAASAEELSAHAQSMQECVTELLALVGTHRAPALPASRAHASLTRAAGKAKTLSPAPSRRPSLRPTPPSPAPANGNSEKHVLTAELF